MSRSRSRRFGKKKNMRQKIARERIHILLELARASALEKDNELADRYAQLARRISMRYKVRMPRGFKLNFCRHCQRYLLPGSGSRLRLSGGRLTRQCLKCSSYYRLPLGRK